VYVSIARTIRRHLTSVTISLRYSPQARAGKMNVTAPRHVDIHEHVRSMAGIRNNIKRADPIHCCTTTITSLKHATMYRQSFFPLWPPSPI